MSVPATESSQNPPLFQSDEREENLQYDEPRNFAPLDKITFQPKESSSLLDEIKMKRFAQLAPNYRIRIKLPFNNDIELGFGVNPEGRIFPKAINYNGTESIDSYANSDQRIFSVVTKKENEKEIRTLAGMKVSGFCYEVSGELEYMAKAITDEKTMHLFILHSYESNKKIVIKDPKLLNGAKSFLNERGLSAFIEAYGTHYVSGFINAASFFGEIKIKTSSTENAKKIGVKANAVVKKLGSLKAEYSNEEQSLDSNYEMEVRTSIRGLSINEQIATISQLWETYGKFIEQLNNETPPRSPYLAVCDPWTNLPEVAEIGPIFDNYGKLETNVNKKIEKTILEEVANYFTVSKYEEAAAILLLSKTLYSFPEFIKRCEEKTNKSTLSSHLQHFTQVLLETQNPRGERIAKEYLEKYVDVLKKSLNARVETPLPKIAFGKADWETYFGDVGKVPPLPADIEKILKGPCPIWEGRRVEDTHLLVLIPKTVNGAPLTLNHLSDLITKPRGGGRSTKYRNYNSNVKKELGNAPVLTSRWVLMTRDVIPNSRRKSYADQCMLAQELQKRTGIAYELPFALEATVAILMHYVKTGERLYPDEPWTYTRCQEKVNNNKLPVAIGGFGAGGLAVRNYFFPWDVDHIRGVGVCRLF